MISVIVPVFKAENYIGRCVKSIMEQEYTDWELLLVDDGSPDKSGEICDQLACQDVRIRVFHKKNGGVSSARNYGLDNAHGEWVCFIDADDYIGGDYFSCVDKCKNDLIFQQSCHYTKDMIIENHEYAFPKMQLFTFNSVRSFLSLFSNTQKVRTPWSKIFRRSKIGNLRFNEDLRVGEDTTFVFNFLLDHPSISIVNTGTYYYLESEVSDRNKYALSEEKGLYTLHQIFDAYDKLNAYNIQLDRSMYCFFLHVCTENNQSEISSWNNDSLICRLKESKIKSSRIKYRVFHHLLKMNLSFLCSREIMLCMLCSKRNSLN